MSSLRFFIKPSLVGIYISNLIYISTRGYDPDCSNPVQSGNKDFLSLEYLSLREVGG